MKHLDGVDNWSIAPLCFHIQGKGRRCTVARTAFCTAYDNVVFRRNGDPAVKKLIQSLMAVRFAMPWKTSVGHILQGHNQIS